MIKLKITNWEAFRETHEDYLYGRWGDEALSYKEIKRHLLTQIMSQLRNAWCLFNGPLGFQTNILSTWDDKFYCFNIVGIKCNYKGIQKIYVFYKGTYKG